MTNPTKKYSTNSNISREPTGFTNGLRRVGKTQAKISAVIQQYLDVAFDSLNEHASHTLLNIAVTEAGKMHGINAQRLLDYVMGTVSNVKCKIETKPNGDKSYTFSKAVKGKENPCVITKSTDWYTFTKATKAKTKEFDQFATTASFIKKMGANVGSLDAQTIKLLGELSKHMAIKEAQAKLAELMAA